MNLKRQFISREMREFRQRFESLSHELKRKEMQIKELQGRIDSGDGCKLHFLLTILVSCIYVLHSLYFNSMRHHTVFPIFSAIQIVCNVYSNLNLY